MELKDKLQNLSKHSEHRRTIPFSSGGVFMRSIASVVDAQGRALCPWFDSKCSALDVKCAAERP